jgi:hypothetical protein
MKYYLIIAIVLWLMSACRDRDDIKHGLPLETEAAQTFLVDAAKDTVVVGRKGTRIKFPKNCFVDSTGKEIKGQVEITLKEFNNIRDFISNRLSTTTTDGRILSSSGMVFLDARAGNSSLRLKDASPLTIMFPRIVDSDIANLFSGQAGENDEIQWELLEPVHYDTTVIVKEISDLMSEMDSFELYQDNVGKTIEVQFVIGPDTIPLTDQNQKSFDNILSRTSRYTDLKAKALRDKNEYTRLKTQNTLQFYIFETTTLGYLNCDIFIKDELHPFTVQLTNAESTVFIILDSLNAIIYPGSATNVSVNNDVNASRVFNLPKNKSVTVVSYRVDNNSRYYFGLTKSNTSMTKLSVTQEERTLDQIKETIGQL